MSGTSNIAGLVDRLEKRGLVRRKNAVDDRRAYRVVLTSAGRELIGKVLPHYYRVAEEVWEGFPEASARKWTAYLQRLSANSKRIVSSK